MSKDSLKVVLQSKGIKQMLRSKEMKNMLTEYAFKTKSKLGEGYSVSSYTGKTRVNVSIVAETPKAIKENKRHNTILKALGGK